MRIRMSTLAFIAAVGGVAAAAGVRADVIELKDGRSFIGVMARQGDAILITTTDGLEIQAKPSDVAKVTLTNSITPAEAAGAEWTRSAAAIKQANEDRKSVV